MKLTAKFPWGGECAPLRPVIFENIEDSSTTGWENRKVEYDPTCRQLFSGCGNADHTVNLVSTPYFGSDFGVEKS